MAKQILVVLSMKDKIIAIYTHTAFDTHKMLCEKGQWQFQLSDLRNSQLSGPNSNCNDVH